MKPSYKEGCDEDADEEDDEDEDDDMVRWIACEGVRKVQWQLWEGLYEQDVQANKNKKSQQMG